MKKGSGVRLECLQNLWGISPGLVVGFLVGFSWDQNSHRCAILCCGKSLEGVVAPWCSPLTLQLQPEQSGGVGLIPGRTPPLERHDKGLLTQLGPPYFCDPTAWR